MDDPLELDSFDELLVRAAGAPSVMPPLAAGAVVADRYEVSGVLGAGGMGTVYLAHDRSLDRSIALKLHHAPAAGPRLRREALAMAKLAHPNVVTVYEVGALEGRTFVAMELVAGATLRAWLASRPRRAEILDALVAVGQGLAAAHDAGIVHRDVKPDNVLVGRDGRVRIGDFGLARADGERVQAAPLTEVDARTVTGAMLGTPAYMAPEQLAGGELDARTDQFAFCVLAWEALGGRRPYDGANTGELLRAIERAQVRASPHRIAPSIRRVLERGLAAEPARRWPSMRALIAALRAAERRPRLVAAASALVIAAGAATWAAWPAPSVERVCAATADDLAAQWPAATTRALVDAVRASGAPFAGEDAAALAAELDGFRRAHRASEVRACEARGRRQWSASLASAARDCRRANVLVARALFDRVPVSAATASDLVVLGAELPTFEACDDARVLASRAAPVEVPPVLHDEVRATQAALDAAKLVLDLGYRERAQAARNQLAAAPLIRTAGLASRLALLDAGLVLASGSDLRAAERALSEVYFAARAADDGEVLLRAVSELIEVTAAVQRDREAAARWIQIGLADAARERSRSPVLAAAVLAAAASAEAIAGPSERVLAYVATAGSYVDVARHPLLDSRLESARASALSRAGRVDEALASSDRRLAQLQRAVGPRHAAVATAYVDRVSILLDANRSGPALEAARAARAILDAQPDVSGAEIQSARVTIGAALVGIEDPEGERYLDLARANVVAEFGEDHLEVAQIDSNLALVYLGRGETERAVAALRGAVRRQERALGADHYEVAASYYNLAVAERDARQYDAAIASARRASAGFRGGVRRSYAHTLIAMIANLAGRHELALAEATRAAELAPPDDAFSGAWARQEHATALIALRRDLASARRLLEDARAAYVRIELAPRVAQVDGLLAKLQ